MYIRDLRLIANQGLTKSCTFMCFSLLNIFEKVWKPENKSIGFFLRRITA